METVRLHNDEGNHLVSSTRTRRWIGGATALLLGAAITAGSAAAETTSSAQLSGFHDGYVRNDNIRVHYVVGGHGPALVLLHGWPETWRAWAKLAPDLARDHTVIAVDLRGLGDSGVAPTDAGSYTALAVASDVHAVVNQLGFKQIDLAGHDWGGGVALAYAAQYRTEVRKLAVLEAPPTSDYLKLVKENPGVLWWDWFINGPGDTLSEKLVTGREREFYTWFYSQSQGTISADQVNRYVAAYSRPGSTHAGFEYFRQQDQGEAAVDQLFAKDGKLTIPVLGVGGEQSMGGLIGAALPRVATNVTPAVVKGANHWLLEEQPAAVLSLLTGFFQR